MNWKKNFHRRIWNGPTGKSTCSTENVTKKSSRYLFLAYVYITLVNVFEVTKVLILSPVFTIIFRFFKTLLITLISLRTLLTLSI